MIPIGRSDDFNLTGALSAKNCSCLLSRLNIKKTGDSDMTSGVINLKLSKCCGFQEVNLLFDLRLKNGENISSVVLFTNSY